MRQRLEKRGRQEMVEEPILTLLSKWSVPFGIATSIIGGSAWLTSTANRVDQVTSELRELKADYKENKDHFDERVTTQDKSLSEVKQKLSGMDAKLDLMIDAIKNFKD